MRQRVLLGNAAQQQDRFRDDQFGHGTRIGKRRVEHRHAGTGRGVEVYLRGADAEAADGHEVLGGFDFRRAKVRGGANAENLVGRGRAMQFVARERTSAALYGDVRFLEALDGGVMDVFKQQC